MNVVELTLSPLFWFRATACFIAAPVNSLTVLSNSQVHIANTGETVHLQCLFLADNFNLFHYPVLWLKTQLDEDVQVGELLKYYFRFDVLILPSACVRVHD